jgi:hypothetical protein
MTASDELKALINKRDAVIAEMAANLFAELQARTPVSDTLTREDGSVYHTGGSLKAAWEMQKVNDGWLFSNNMEYASFIFGGIREVNGKKIGSKQLPDGVYPIIQDFNKELQIRLDMIK